jgi:hypothetical protein
MFYSDANVFTGLALANTSARTANLTLTAYNASGNRFTASGVQNPARMTLAPFAQKALITDQIFGFPTGFATEGWVEISSDNDGVTGFFLFGDYLQEYLDGADIDSDVNTELVFPGVSVTSTVGTEISLVNPDPQRPALASANLYDSSGRQLAYLDRIYINPMGRIAGSIPALFGVTQLDMGHVEVHSDRGLTGVMMTRAVARVDGSPPNRMAILRAQSRVFQPQRLYIPQFVSGSGFSSLAILANPSNVTADVRITFMGQDGGPLTGTYARAIPPHGSTIVESSMFGIGGDQTQQGYLRVEASGSYIVGCAYFEDSGVTILAGANLLSQGGLESYISQLATGLSGYYTGVACLNISSVTAVVEISLYDPSGMLLAQGTRILEPGQRFSELVDQLTGFTSSQQGGYVRLMSNQPVIAFGVVGTERTLASVPAQIVR